MDIKPWDMGTEVAERPNVPSFTKAKFMITKVVPPKGKTIRDGLVVHAALISYNNEGSDVKVTEVVEGPGGYAVEFPLGKFLVSATKYRGPKSIYNFVHPTSGKWTKIEAEKFTVPFAESYLSTSIPNWAELDDLAKEDHVDTYFEDMYNFGLACDFNFDTTEKDHPKVTPGMVVEFYRRYTPPAEDEKYGRTIITKWPSKKNLTEKEYESLDGSFELKDAIIAEAILTALQTSDKPKEFDPASDDGDVPF